MCWSLNEFVTLTQGSIKASDIIEYYIKSISKPLELWHKNRNALRQLFDIVLRCNVFSFNGQIYQQIQGTAMGTKMAPSYANLFMDRFERAFLAQEPILPLVWKRYIDDILCIWTGTRSELDGFLDRLNKAHRTLRFTWSISNERIEFLDLNIFKGGKFNTTNHLDISTHFKTTNTFQYLHFSSSHPRSILLQYNKYIQKAFIS